jgi:hypothetical protein
MLPATAAALAALAAVRRARRTGAAAHQWPDERGLNAELAVLEDGGEPAGGAGEDDHAADVRDVEPAEERTARRRGAARPEVEVGESKRRRLHRTVAHHGRSWRRCSVRRHHGLLAAGYAARRCCATYFRMQAVKLRVPTLPALLFRPQARAAERHTLMPRLLAEGLRRFGQFAPRRAQNGGWRLMRTSFHVQPRGSFRRGFGGADAYRFFFRFAMVLPP